MTKRELEIRLAMAFLEYQMAEEKKRQGNIEDYKKWLDMADYDESYCNLFIDETRRSIVYKVL